MYKKQGILGLFLLLVVILVLKPRIILNMYNNILGRVVLIGLVLFFTTCHVALGLLAALCLIIVSNMFFMVGVNIEGLTNLDNKTESDTMIQPGLTIGDDNVTTNNTNNKLNVITKAKERANANGITVTGDGSKLSELQAQAQEEGVDRQTVQETIQSKSCKAIPVDKSKFESNEVQASEPTTSVTESFNNKHPMGYAPF
jgi:hypothetical protein